MSGNLYIVATPIGNLRDISQRALDILKNVQMIACEDTRVTKRLLNFYKINNKMISYNDYNEDKKSNDLIKLLHNNDNIALVSDAGTPTISDPGYRIVNKALIQGYKVFSIPGPCSAIAALSISGLPTDKFYFEGFLPKKKGRQTHFIFLKSLDSTIIIYESPKRILKTLQNILDIMGDRIISIVKEVSKIHETVFFGRIKNIMKKLNNKNLKGEFVILISKDDYTIDE